MPDRAREIIELLTAGGLGAGVVGGFWAWLSKRPTGQAAVIEAATKLQEALNVAAERQVSGFRAEIEDLRAEGHRLRDRIEALEGENRQMRQHTESLEALLRRQGIDIPKATAPGALLVVADGLAQVIRADEKEPPHDRPSRRRSDEGRGRRDKRA